MREVSKLVLLEENGRNKIIISHYAMDVERRQKWYDHEVIVKAKFLFETPKFSKINLNQLWDYNPIIFEVP